MWKSLTAAMAAAGLLAASQVTFASTLAPSPGSQLVPESSQIVPVGIGGHGGGGMGHGGGGMGMGHGGGGMGMSHGGGMGMSHGFGGMGMGHGSVEWERATVPLATGL